MLFNGQFSSIYLFTIFLILGLFTIVGICYSAYRFWLFSKPARKKILQLVIPLFNLLNSTSHYLFGIIKKIAIKIVGLFIIPLWQRVLSPAVFTLYSILKRIPWGKCVLAMAILCLPTLMARLLGIPFRAILPIAVAGATIGFCLAPFFNWQLYKTKPLQGIAHSLLFIIGGAWVSPLLIATLMAAASD
jgi:hypothetical protein